MRAEIAQLAEHALGKGEVLSSILSLGSLKNTAILIAVFFMDIKLLVQKFCEYSSYIKGYSIYTIKRYKRVINFYCSQAGIKEIEETSQDNVRNFFFQGRARKKWLSSSFISYYNSLSVFFSWCIKEGYIKNNPVNDVEKPKLEKRLPVRLNKQDALRLLESVYNYPYNYKFLRYRNYAIFATFIFAGIRKKELLNLKYTDVDLENMSIFIRQGKWAKDRVIPICYKLADILKKYLTERSRLNKTCSSFFTSLNRNMGLTDIGIRRLVGKIRQASGLKFTIHKLRHTFATLMLEGGCDIYSLAKMMGHSDIRTTTIYLAASVDHLRKQIIKHPLNDI